MAISVSAPRNPDAGRGTAILGCAILAAGCAILPAGCARVDPAAPARPEGSAPPAVAREFRGVWVASVSHIDWPSAPGLRPDSQRAELRAIMERAAALRMNAVILQVRPAGDALYDSPHEPWSEYLTGEMGRPPEPYYDPLRYAIEEAHARGLELHAWFNPYRARHPSATSPISGGHLSRTRPDLVVEYGAHLWMDPGEPEVREHSIRVILDVVRRYDIDGVHIDDYFYPYRERDAAGALLPFPDDASWARYQAAGGRLGREDWRRSNVDALVERLYEEIRREKRWVRFGVSPIGIWRPGHPPGVCCFDAYEEIYADARKWLAEGWLDYFVPQLYRPIADTLMSYPLLLGWWAEQNRRQRHLFAGMIPNRVRSPARPDGWPAEEIVRQVLVARGHPGASGHVHFSARALLESPDSLVEALAARAYRAPALVPHAWWLPGDPPPRASATLAPDPEPGTSVLRLSVRGGGSPRWWVVRTRRDGRWTVDVHPGRRDAVRLTGAGTLEEVAVSAVDRLGAEGPVLRLPSPTSAANYRTAEPQNRRTAELHEPGGAAAWVRGWRGRGVDRGLTGS